MLLSHWHIKSLKGQKFSWLYINTIHLSRVEKSTTEVRNKKKKSVSPSSQPKSLQLPPGNYLRNKQVLIHISAVGREFCIAASTVPTVLTTAQLWHPVLHWHKPKEQFRNTTWPHQQGCGQLRVIMVQDTVPDTSLGDVHWRITVHIKNFLLNLENDLCTEWKMVLEKHGMAGYTKRILPLVLVSLISSVCLSLHLQSGDICTYPCL